MLRWNTRTLIGHRDHGLLFASSNANGDRRIRRGILESVGDEVDDGPLDAIRVGWDRRHMHSGLDTNTWPFFWRSNSLHDLAHQVREVDGFLPYLELTRFQAGRLHQLLDHHVHVLCAPDDRVDALPLHAAGVA